MLGLILSGGQAGDALVGEEVLTRKEIKAVGGDRAYDRDAIHAMIKAAGKEAMVPPRSKRVAPADYDKEKYKGRNKVERLFNRLKGYRAVATRYDKLATMFLGGVLATLLAISLKSIVNTPQGGRRWSNRRHFQSARDGLTRSSKSRRLPAPRPRSLSHGWHPPPGSPTRRRPPQSAAHPAA